jgi:hypothetical protein
MQRCSFLTRYQNWVAPFLIAASSHVLLNGLPGDPIAHKRGLRQGYPLSPAAIRPYYLHVAAAPQHGQGKYKPLYCLKGRSPMIHTSVYAGDAAICHNFQSRLLGVGSYFGVCQ